MEAATKEIRPGIKFPSGKSIIVPVESDEAKKQDHIRRRTSRGSLFSSFPYFPRDKEFS
jgi:hypothetical protein